MAHVDGLPEMRLWRLDRIVSIDLLDRGFKRREDFDLMAYATQSFGVFQEDPIDVVLRFTTESAEDASGWLFHPSQSMEHEKDGALIQRFPSRLRAPGRPCPPAWPERCGASFTRHGVRGGHIVQVSAPSNRPSPSPSCSREGSSVTPAWRPIA